MSAEFREQLQQALGSAYTIERELGGGGMSRVFVATETAIGRAVVIKVLPPELAAGVNVERFRREIQLAGKLTHPHIVGILSAGIADGLPYYSMPLIDGESLRARLTRAGELSVAETVRIMREVADALAYAHEHRVIHRDIKPDNVLISAGHAVVTDFGVAKAIAESASESGLLTSIGVALGTPAYMAPEQAAADPHVDARADLYALGAMTYEMLTGQPPFAGRSAQMVLAAHLTETPDPVGKRRPSVPPELGALVMRLLEKRPADRPQTALELLGALESLASRVSGTESAAPPERRRTSNARALAIYLGTSALAIGTASLATRLVGLPLWVVSGTALVMALGLPVIALAVLAQGKSSAMPLIPGTRSFAASRLGSALAPWLTWRRVTLGGAISLSVFIVLVAGYMALRSLGIGSAGSLLAAGVLSSHDRVLVTEFRSPAGDSTIGPAIAGALQADLEQARVVSVVSSSAVQAALARMRLAPGTHLDLQLAREIAAREGIKVIVDGEVARLGSGYSLSAQLVSAQNGEVLAAYRESAHDPDALIPAVDAISRRLRAKIGESLRSVNDAPPLDQVTTSSLEALRKFSQGTRVWREERNFAKARALLLAAISLDTNFASAYQRLGMLLVNYGGSTGASEGIPALRKAHDLRDRLPELERHIVSGIYFSYGGAPYRSSALSEFQAALEIAPDNAYALHMAASVYGQTRDHARACEFETRALTVDSTYAFAHTDLAYNRFALGDTAGAFGTIRVMLLHSDEPLAFISLYTFYASTGRYDSARAQASHLEQLKSNLRAQVWAAEERDWLAAIHGRLLEAAAALRRRTELAVEEGDSMAALDESITTASRLTWFLDRPNDAVHLLDETIKRYGLAARPPLERRYLARALEYARAGIPARARALMAEWAKQTPPFDRGNLFEILQAQGAIAFAEGHYDSAAALFRSANESACEVCGLDDLARAYDLSGQPDSAIAITERYLATPAEAKGWLDARWLAPAHKRLGELYDARGDTGKALDNYAKFVALWKDADPELRRQVAQVKRRMQELVARKG